MTQQPRLEARVRSQERQISDLSARVEEIADDMEKSFGQLVSYHVGQEQQLNGVDARLEKVEHRLETVEQRLETLATKEDLAAMQTQILENFKQLIAILNAQQKKEGQP